MEKYLEKARVLFPDSTPVEQYNMAIQLAQLDNSNKLLSILENMQDMLDKVELSIENLNDTLGM